MDTALGSAEDGRRGLTLRVWHRKSWRRCRRPAQLQPLLTNQYIIPATDLHLTILTLISCDSRCVPDPARPGRMRISCPGNRPLPALDDRISRADGLAVLPDVAGISQGSFGRARRPGRLRASDLPHSLDVRYCIHTAHVSILRFVIAPGPDRLGRMDAACAPLLRPSSGLSSWNWCSTIVPPAAPTRCIRALPCGGSALSASDSLAGPQPSGHFLAYPTPDIRVLATHHGNHSDHTGHPVSGSEFVDARLYHRFLAIASIIRTLHSRYNAEGKTGIVRRQFKNLRISWD